MNHEYITISQINNFIKMIFDGNSYLQKVYLKGEISNFKRHSSGHLYLTLKDEESRISAIMFRSMASKLTFVPEDGMNVLVEGRISVYPAGGNYQIYIDKMEQDGLGNLYVEFEKLKKKLAGEGLFDVSHKKPIPKFPKKIGIVTAPTGAAIKDILSTITRRFPLCETILFPSLVQGVQAKEDIVKNIKKANEYDLDVLIVGRGGGSIEDLWAFNEEIVARAIYESKIPIISAVGHEVDVTIADFVADKRAPTPTGAAEMAVPTIEEVKNLFQTKQIEISNAFLTRLNEKKHHLKKLADSFILKNPMVLYDVKIQKLDDLTDKLKNAMDSFLENKTKEINHLKEHYIMKNPLIMYQNKIEEIKKNQEILQKNIEAILNKKNHDFAFIVQTLKLVNPLNILDKGYSLIKKDGHILKESSKIKEKDILNVRLSKGELSVEVKEIIS